MCFATGSGMSTATAATTRCRSMGLRTTTARRCLMGRAGMGSSAMGNRRARMDGSAGTNAAAYRGTAARIMSAIGSIAATTVVASAALTAEAVLTPAVSVTPARPRAHAQEDAVVEIPWPVETHGRALVWRIVVVAVRANRLNPDAYGNLCLRRWRHGQAGNQYCC